MLTCPIRKRGNTMKQALNELMWAAHRAEGEAAHAANDVTGIFVDIRDEEAIPVDEGDINVFNLGVSNGIKTFLDHLSENGYTISGPDGNPIEQLSHGCKKEPLGETWQAWLLSGGKNLTEEE
ncbi:hypothetical protein D3C78_824120 [compost metagenome]